VIVADFAMASATSGQIYAGNRAIQGSGYDHYVLASGLMAMVGEYRDRFSSALMQLGRLSTQLFVLTVAVYWFQLWNVPVVMQLQQP
jgi:hypothetical protein